MRSRLLGFGIALTVIASLAFWLNKTPMGDTESAEKSVTVQASGPTELSMSIDADMLETTLERQQLGDAGAESPKVILEEVDQEYLDKHFVMHRDVASELGRLDCVPIEVATGLRLCWEQFGYHPYLQYDLLTLTTLAPTDPVASAALSIILSSENPKASLYYALQASNQTGKSGPLVRYLEMTHVLSKDTERLLDLYAIALYAEEVGWDRPLSGQYRYWISSNGLSEAEINERMNNRRIDASLDGL